MPKVLISDKMSSRAEAILKEQGIQVDVKPGLSKESLLEIIGEYEGLLVRSATKVRGEVLEAATKLKVIGRAGIGVDNIDIPGASKRGIIVMNTPYGNTVTTAEHTFAMIIAASRMIPQATASMKAGRWEKSLFEGVELYQKTLGVVGVGNIGSRLVERAQGFGMRCIAYDPYIGRARAEDLGVELVDMDTLLARADFVSLHTPLTDATRHLINHDTLHKLKPGAILVNVARGGIVDENALYEALKSGHLRAAALDVFEKEPVTAHKLLELENFICTPHLGASTKEAQINVAIQVSEQVAAYLLRGVVQNAVNIPAVSEEELPVLQPLLNLGERLGLLLGQLAESGLERVVVEFAGDMIQLNTRPLKTAVLQGIMQSVLPETVNMVNAPFLAKERGIEVEEHHRELADNLRSRLRVTLFMDGGTIEASGTVVHDRDPRLLAIDGIDLEASLEGHMLYVVNEDQPGFIGQIGSLLANYEVNIADFHLGRIGPGQKAVSLIAVDSNVSDGCLQEIRSIDKVIAAKRLDF